MYGCMYDDNMILDFFKMKLIMNRDNSSNVVETVFTMIMIMAIPYIIEQLKKISLSLLYLIKPLL